MSTTLCVYIPSLMFEYLGEIKTLLQIFLPDGVDMTKKWGLI